MPVRITCPLESSILASPEAEPFGHGVDDVENRTRRKTHLPGRLAEKVEIRSENDRQMYK